MNHLFRDMQKVRRLARVERRAGLRKAYEGARYDPFRGKQQHRLRMALRVPILSSIDVSYLWKEKRIASNVITGKENALNGFGPVFRTSSRKL